MTNSSDWISALQERPAVPKRTQSADDWIARLGAREGFVDGLPFAQPNLPPMPADEPEEPPAPVAPTPEPPQPDPVAEAFERGFEEGRAMARAGAAEEAAQRAAIRKAFGALDQAAMDALAADLADTVLALCAAVIAQYEPSKADLLERCNTAAHRLGTAPPDIRLHLHPDDLALIEAADEMPDWECVGDPDIGRGGLRLETPEGAVSDTPEDWRRVIRAAIQG
jgi:flagellar assembly protein FliH